MPVLAPPAHSGFRAVAALWLSLTVCACDYPPSAAGVPTWTPSDHDHSDEKERVASGAQAAPSSSGSKQKQDGNRALVEATWRSQCANCHGAVGHGDGPNGLIVRAADLTRSDWQAGVTDAQIAATITNGKGRMPKFDLPPALLSGIVSRIRASRGQ